MCSVPQVTSRSPVPKSISSRRVGESLVRCNNTAADDDKSFVSWTSDAILDRNVMVNFKFWIQIHIYLHFTWTIYHLANDVDFNFDVWSNRSVVVGSTIKSRFETTFRNLNISFVSMFITFSKSPCKYDIVWWEFSRCVESKSVDWKCKSWSWSVVEQRCWWQCKTMIYLCCVWLSLKFIVANWIDCFNYNWRSR
jgi:hypothetical protein